MKVLQLEIDESIVLPESCDNMPDSIKQPLLATLTHAMKVYDCKYEDLTWKVKMYKGQPVIHVKKR